MNPEQTDANCRECGRPVKARGLCQHHYDRGRHDGTLLIRHPDPVRRKLVKLLSNIVWRCTKPAMNRYECYGGKGIQCLLSLEDLRFLWERDKAVAMAQPSIDRKEVAGHYELGNCRFIEFAVNRAGADHSTKRRYGPCARCGAQIYGRSKNGGRCVDCAGYRRCKECREWFLVPTEGARSRFCLKHRSIEGACLYCGAKMLRVRGQDSGALRNQNWFCSKREQGLWLADRGKAWRAASASA